MAKQQVTFPKRGEIYLVNFETIRLWNPNTGKCLRVLRPERIYESMNITGATGITSAQQATLKGLGAIEII